MEEKNPEIWKAATIASALTFRKIEDIYAEMLAMDAAPKVKNTKMNIAPYVFYLIGSLCFIAGSVLALIAARRK